MNDEQLRDLGESLRRLIQPYMRQSEPLRRLMEGLGQILVEEAQRAAKDDSAKTVAAQSTSTDETENGPRIEASVHSPASVENESVAHEAVPLRLGDETIRVAVSGTTEEINTARAAFDQSEKNDRPLEADPADDREIDLKQVEQRCRLKADACYLYIERCAASDDPDRMRPIIKKIDGMIARAKEMPQCFLWVFWRERSQPDDETLRMIARCYTALADAVYVLHQIESLGEQADEEHLAEAMEITAESHSALRVALMKTWLTGSDADQMQTHHWLRRESTIRRIYLPRYMKLDDPADPQRANAVSDEAQRLAHRVERHADRLKRIDQEFKKIRYHARQIERTDNDPDTHDFLKIVEAVESLRSCDVPPTDRRFRQAISAHVAELFTDEAVTSERPAEVIEHVRQWHRANEDGDRDDGPSDVRPRSDRIEKVRSLLARRTVVVVGGEPRPDAEQRIRDAFDLDAVTWVRLTEHGSSEPMRAPISRAETALVIVLVKLAGHQHVEDAKAWAREHGTPCVVLPAGYNPEQIAEAVLQQASEQFQDQN